MEITRLKKEQIDIYNAVGRKSYYQHYLHLWENREPEPYISTSFTENVVLEELKDPNLAHFIIKLNSEAVGVMKTVINAELNQYPSEKAMLLEKIYLLNEYSGKGLGKRSLDYIVEFARSYNKEILWLDTMKNGRPLPFYLDYGFEIIGEKELNFNKVIPAEKTMYILQYKLA